MLASKVKNLTKKNAVKDLGLLRKILKTEKYDFPVKFKEFKRLINKRNYNRINCINLPLDAVLKALQK